MIRAAMISGQNRRAILNAIAELTADVAALQTSVSRLQVTANTLLTRTERIIVSQQEADQEAADIDAAVTSIAADQAAQTAALNDIVGQSATILTEIQALEAQVAQGQPVDLSGIRDKITALQSQAQAATAETAQATAADTAVQTDAAAGAPPAPPAP